MSVVIKQAALARRAGTERRLAQLRAVFARWRRRARSRAELARFSERELRDIGLSRGEALQESDKPFWRG